jgi:DNA modification methylase
MRQMPDNCVDLVLTDPPYGIFGGAKSIGGSNLADVKEYPPIEWDSEPFDITQFQACQWISKNQIVFGFNHFCDVFPPTPSVIVWDKDNGDNNFADCELAWTSFETAVRKVKWKWQGMLQENMGNKDERYHPTQKPLGVMMWILERYSNPNDLIFDPFCGSGTTCVAAKRLGRRYIGIDISEEYCEIARKRLEAEEKGITVKELERGQGSLFGD